MLELVFIHAAYFPTSICVVKTVSPSRWSVNVFVVIRNGKLVARAEGGIGRSQQERGGIGARHLVVDAGLNLHRDRGVADQEHRLGLIVKAALPLCRGRALTCRRQLKGIMDVCAAD